MRAQHLCVAAMAALVATTSALASVEINGNPTKNMTCTAGICSPTAKSAVLNTTDLANMLATGDVTVTTGNGAVTITVSGPFSWTSTHRLTLDANLNVSFRAPVEVAGQGAVTIITNDGGTGGELLFFDGGKIDFWDLGSSLIVDGQTYKLESDVKSLATDIMDNEGAGYYALANDYDAAQDGTYKKSPIYPSFIGSFEGLGHTIANLKIKERPCEDLTIGMFNGIGEGGVVRDLNLKNVSASSDRPHWVGGLAGLNSGLIFNVSTSGHTSTVSGTIAQCQIIGYVGGLVGYNGGKIVFSRSSVSVSAGYVNHPYGSLVGGLAGISTYIDRSYATGSVSANTASTIGGLAGSADNITRSFTIGPAGLVGTGGVISDSYAIIPLDKKKAPAATCSSYSAFVGLDYGGIHTSYTNNACFAYEFGEGALPSTDDYWDTTTGQEGCASGDCTGVKGISDKKLKSGLPRGFSKSVWTQDPNINNGYPYLIDNPAPQ